MYRSTFKLSYLSRVMSHRRGNRLYWAYTNFNLEKQW